MKELIMKRQKELEEIYNGVHMDVDSDSARQMLICLIDSGSSSISLFPPYILHILLVNTDLLRMF